MNKKQGNNFTFFELSMHHIYRFLMSVLWKVFTKQH